MKKILFLLFFILSFDAFAGFESITQSSFVSKKSNFPTCSTSVKSFQSTATTGGTTYYYDPYDYRSFKKSVITSTMHIDPSSGNMIYGSATEITYSCSGSGTPICTTEAYSDGLLLCKSDTDPDPDIVPNPDPNGGSTCRDGFVKDGQYYNCNPNTNEAELVPNSDGYEEDEEGNQYPKCNDGFENNSSIVISNGNERTYNTQSCVQQSNTDSPGTGDNGSFPDAPTTSVGADGSTSWTWGDGTTQTLSPNGTLTTYYPDGTNSVKQVGNDYTPSTGGTSGGGSGTGGTGGAGTNGNTTNETDTPNNNDTPIDETPVSNSCSDSSLTLQEKMLCEMNAGMKKLNSESSPQNSLNNLIKEMNKDNNTNTTAINTNIKETNKLLTDTKALNENQLSELKNVTKELKKLNASTGTTSSVVSPEVNPFEPAEEDNGGIVSTFESDKNLIDSFFDIYTNFKDNLLGHQDTLNNLINNTASTINGGIGLSLSTTEIINCPLNYNLDMTSTLGKNIPFNIDICEITSKTKPYLYPIFLILFTVGTVFFAFRFIGVLL